MTSRRFSTEFFHNLNKTPIPANEVLHPEGHKMRQVRPVADKKPAIVAKHYEMPPDEKGVWLGGENIKPSIQKGGTSEIPVVPHMVISDEDGGRSHISMRRAASKKEYDDKGSGTSGHPPQKPKYKNIPRVERGVSG